jgi:hypothetical protein
MNTDISDPAFPGRKAAEERFSLADAPENEKNLSGVFLLMPSPTNLLRREKDICIRDHADDFTMIPGHW